jgi:hypothetical protein
VKAPIRQVLGDSHIAAVAIAVLLLRSFELGVQHLGQPLILIAGFLIHVVATRAIPYGSFTFGQWLMLIPAVVNFIGSFILVTAAWFLSRWVFGMGPFRSLTDCCAKLARRTDA